MGAAAETVLNGMCCGGDHRRRARCRSPAAGEQEMSRDGSQYNMSSAILPALGARSYCKMKLRWYIVSPYGRQYRAWESFLIILVVYTAWVSPFEFGFFQKPHRALTIADNIVNGFFAIDIILTFFVAYLDRTTYLLIDNPKQIAWKYTTSWFILDLIATIPSEVVHKIISQKILSYGYYNILRLWRLRRVSSLFARWEKDINFNYFWVRCGRLTCVTLFGVHCAGCIMYFLVATYPDPSKTRIGASFPDFHYRSLCFRYVTSIYWAITTLATVGYGDLHPVNTREMVFDILFMFFNLGLYAYLIGNMTSLVVHGTRRTREFRDKIQAATEFAHRNRLPDRLLDQMRAHMSLKHRINSEGLQQQAILESLPKAIQSGISNYLFYPLILKAYLFRGVSSDLLFQLVSEMKAEYYPPREDLILQNEAPTAVYLLVAGTMELIDYKNGQEQVVREAKSGDLVGEIGVLCNRPQIFTVRTKKLCQLLRLNRTSFMSIIQLNVGDGTIIMDNLLQYLKEQEDPIMTGIFKETENMITHGRLDLPLTLCFSAIRGDDRLLHQLLRRGRDPNETDSNGRTALHIAASKGNVNCVLLLLDYGADPDSRDSEGNVPLWEAILGKHDAVIRLLINHGAGISAGDMAQFACTAAVQNSLELLKEIVRYGGDISLPRKDGSTALHLAVCEGNSQVVKFLIEQGADADKLDHDGWTPRNLADQQSHEEIKVLFRAKKDDKNHPFQNNSLHATRLVARFMSEPSIPKTSHEGMDVPREESQERSQRRQNTKTFQNSLFGIISVAGADQITRPASPRRYFGISGNFHYNHRQLHTPLRVKISCPEKSNIGSKLVELPGTIEELLEIAAKKFRFLPTKVLTVDRAEIDTINVIRDDDHLILVSDSWVDKGDTQNRGGQ